MALALDLPWQGQV